MEGVFERVEYKYVLSISQYNSIIDEINKHFTIDKYGESTIQSLYFDTDDFILARRSIEHPIYKEKLRLRSYGLSSNIDKVYLEIKKKYDGIVYKRRVKINENDVEPLLNQEKDNLSQIEKEIAYLSDLYKGIKPKMLIIYDRVAMIGNDNEIRLTFDKNARYRDSDLNLHTNLTGKNIFDNGEILMEIKTNKPIPLWFCKLLSVNKIYKTTFSKYGTIYKNKLQGEII